MVLWVGLQWVIVAFPGLTLLLFGVTMNCAVYHFGQGTGILSVLKNIVTKVSLT